MNCYEIAPQESVLNRTALPGPPECDFHGIKLDRHPWDGGVCSRCGATRPAKQQQQSAAPAAAEE